MSSFIDCTTCKGENSLRLSFSYRNCKDCSFDGAGKPTSCSYCYIEKMYNHISSQYNSLYCFSCSGIGNSQVCSTCKTYISTTDYYNLKFGAHNCSSCTTTTYNVTYCRICEFGLSAVDLGNFLTILTDKNFLFIPSCSNCSESPLVCSVCSPNVDQNLNNKYVTSLDDTSLGIMGKINYATNCSKCISFESSSGANANVICGYCSTSNITVCTDIYSLFNPICSNDCIGNSCLSTCNSTSGVNRTGYPCNRCVKLPDNSYTCGACGGCNS
jgi:hypothetical protein